MGGLTKAYCVETIDPWKENRVRFYHPRLHDPNTPIHALPFASPISSMGGFDDCGLSWVPPAGSTIAILFENGNREAPYYIGTMWHRDRGPDGVYLNEFPSTEYNAIHKGHRKGYLVGPNDESQVLPPWNTENYNAADIDSLTEFTSDVNQQKRISPPHIYGFKTPGKNGIKCVDGNPKCNNQWKRLEIFSGDGNYMIFKDDHLHYGGQWGHPSCGVNGPDAGDCSETSSSSPYITDPFGKPIEKNATCGTSLIGGHASTPEGTKYANSQKGMNPFFKHENECRPIKGPGTPQNNRLDLPQAGIQLLSHSGHSRKMDDSVQEPRGKPGWERSTQDFDYGCNNIYLGRIQDKSSTGHSFKMDDQESATGVRNDKNGIELLTASGNMIQLNEHTITAGSDGATCIAGNKRGIHLVSTSKNEIHLVDNMNQQCSPTRKEGGVPVAKATEAYMQLITGYGLETRLADDNSQEETQRQYIQITHPQASRSGSDAKANTERGAHFLRFQGRPQGEPGLIFLRAGGHSIRSTYDMDIVTVGDKEKNPSDKFTYVSKMRISSVEDVDFRYSGKQHIFFAEEHIILMAGRDCPPPEGKRCKGPCVYPVIVARCPVVCSLTGIIHWTEQAISERVFASAYNSCQNGGCKDAMGTPVEDCSTYEEQMAAAQGPPCTEDTNG